jgi:D-methionine transport system permease protein
MDDFLNTKVFGVKWSRLLTNIQQTLYMVGWALLIGTIIGFILALALVLTRKGGILKGTGARVVHAVLNFYVNVVRSVPFVILLVTIMPFTRLLMGTTIGSTAALVPLVLYISPYLARLIENSLLECSPGIIEAAQAMGANVFQVIRYFIIPETLGSVVLALTTGTIGLLGASAMAGYVGGGGVGDLALTYGYEKMNTPLMILTVIILIVIVQLIQLLGGAISAKLREHQS